MKRTLLVLGMVMALALSMMAPSVADAHDDGCVALLAGQSTQVGEVCISDDGETLEVTYTTDAPWQLSETHLAVSTNEPSTGEWTQNGWQNRPGNPVPGQFPYSATHDPLVNEYTYTIPFADIGAEAGDELYVAAHAVVRKASSLAPELTWQRSSEEDVAAFRGFGGQWDPEQDGFEIPLDPAQVVWDNGLYFNNNVPLGREFASWLYEFTDPAGGPYAGSSDLRRFQASFMVPEGYEVTAGRLKTTDFDAGIPINDNVYLFVNGYDNLLFWGGTRVNQITDGKFQDVAGVQALRGATEPVETDRWYIPGSFPDVTDLVEGQNVIDVFTEENERWGGLGKLILDLDVFRYETAWGDGMRFVERGNWATYFTYEVEKSLVATGDVVWSPTGGPNVGVEIASTFTAYIDEEGVGSGQIETTNTDTGATSNITIDCVLYEDNEVWMSGANTAGDPVVAYARAGSDPAFNQWTNPNISPQDCTAKWSGASQFISGTIKMF